MSQPAKVFLLVLAGQERDALAFVGQHYPACQSVVLSKRELRESRWRSQLEKLRQLEGEAFVIFTDSLESLAEPLLLRCTTFVHGCRETVLVDSAGSFEVTTRDGFFALLPRILIAALGDAIVLAFTWIGLEFFRLWLMLVSEPEARQRELDLAYLYPSPAGLDAPGGALTHVTGFLSGVVREGARLTVFSGRPVEAACDVHHVPGSRRLCLCREAAILSYNLRFVASARRLLARKKARLLYQRHGKFLFAGALLSRCLGIPLVLEYNASEVWMARYWDPGRFSPWLRLCEKVSLEAASLIVVVSEPLKQQLLDMGVPAERILVNPNAVDPGWFHPQCGGTKLRETLGLQREDIVIGFVGSFSYWHGVSVLEQAIRGLLDEDRHAGPPLKFLLIGDGPLAPELRNALKPYVSLGLVTFTGTIPHNSVRTYLDAADILVSPHVPMPDGSPFFGSPTKLFEYMAMGKAIVASALDQIADVLENGRTALLVRPGDPRELVEAIQRLASDTQLRGELGRSAMEVALARYTWRQNARRVLTYNPLALQESASCSSAAAGTPV
jgi:glycosyltransferase involved in cell wall biosynthesis